MSYWKDRKSVLANIHIIDNRMSKEFPDDIYIYDVNGNAIVFTKDESRIGFHIEGEQSNEDT